MMYAESFLPRLEELARRAAAPEGLEVAWVEFKREGPAWFLRVYLDREEPGVSLDDCRQVSERLSVLLDVEDPIESSYTLEVSSPGLDRPLWREQDYVRFVGRLAKIRTRESPEGAPGQRNFRGRLAGVESGAVLLDRNEGRVAIPLALIERGRLEVELFPQAPARRPSLAARKRS
jgi:ribosome maturation factor RimP